MTLYLSQI